MLQIKEAIIFAWKTFFLRAATNVRLSYKKNLSKHPYKVKWKRCHFLVDCLRVQRAPGQLKDGLMLLHVFIHQEIMHT